MTRIESADFTAESANITVWPWVHSSNGKQVTTHAWECLSINANAQDLTFRSFSSLLSQLISQEFTTENVSEYRVRD